MSLLVKPPLATAAERVAQAVRRSIVSGALPSGTAIRQEDLAAQYNVSRMPVREALRQLEAEGLLTIYPNRAAFVTTLSPHDVQEIYDMRTLLEGDAFRRAWPALPPRCLTRLSSYWTGSTWRQKAPIGAHWRAVSRDAVCARPMP